MDKDDFEDQKNAIIEDFKYLYNFRGEFKTADNEVFYEGYAEEIYKDDLETICHLAESYFEHLTMRVENGRIKLFLK